MNQASAILNKIMFCFLLDFRPRGSGYCSHDRLATTEFLYDHYEKFHVKLYLDFYEICRREEN